MELIDKDAILAEIERLRALLPDANNCDYSQLEFARGQQDILTDFEEFIRTLEVKEVDLDEELHKWQQKYFEGIGYILDGSGGWIGRTSLLDIAKHFYELGLKAKGE